MAASRHALFEALQTAEASNLPPEKALLLLPAGGSADQVLTLTALQRLSKTGLSLSESMRKSGLFEDTEIGLIHLGERSGKLAEVYGWLARHYAKLHGRWQDVYARLKWPLLVWLVAALFLNLPALTGARLGLGSYTLSALLPLSLVLGGEYAFRRHNNRALPAALTELLLRLPWLGDKLRRFHEAVFCHHLGLGLSAGLPLADAVDMAVEGIGNARVKEAFSALASAVNSGSTLSEALLFSNAISKPEGSSVIVTAEATNALPQALQDYARQLANRNEEDWVLLLRGLTIAAWLLTALRILL